MFKSLTAKMCMNRIAIFLALSMVMVSLSMTWKGKTMATRWADDVD